MSHRMSRSVAKLFTQSRDLRPGVTPILSTAASLCSVLGPVNAPRQQRAGFARPVGGEVPSEESPGQEATTASQVQFWLKMSFLPVLFVSIWSREDKRIRNILL